MRPDALLYARETRAYGLWEVALRLPDGRTVIATGLTARQAEYRARCRAQALAQAEGEE